MHWPRILQEAAEELDAAAAYLGRERPGYALVSLEAYEEKLRQLARFPESSPLIENAPAGYPLRAFLVGKFPYSIIAGPIDGVVTIVAIAHTSREPSYWRSRVK
ncbi:MAG: type II toxin-antitoxin system RelE/ParE family toxin [Polyangiales bacterium]